jgi:hypothetical protein
MSDPRQQMIERLERIREMDGRVSMREVVVTLCEAQLLLLREAPSVAVLAGKGEA